MSHVAAIAVEVRDLDALKAAADKLGFDFMEGQRTHKWWGKWLNDWHSPRAASNKGIDPTTFGTCDHALRQRDRPTGYEIGVTAQADDSYRLVYDAIGGGDGIEAKAGEDLVGLRREIAVETTTRFAQRRGYRVQREDDGQTIRLHLQQ